MRSCDSQLLVTAANDKLLRVWDMRVPYVCVYVSMYLCMYVCVPVCVHMCAYVCVCVW